MTPEQKAEREDYYKTNTPDWQADLSEEAFQDEEARHSAFRRVDPEGRLSKLEEAFVVYGIKEAVLPAMFLCVLNDLPLPEWLKKGFGLQYLRGMHGRLKSWNDAWGRPKTKAEYVRAFRQRFKSAEAWDYVMEASSRGQPINDELFERIGRERGLGGREITKQLYSAHRKHRT